MDLPPPMDLVAPTHWPESVQVTGEVAQVVLAGQSWRRGATDGAFLGSAPASQRLEGAGGAWEFGEGGALRWLPDGGAPVPIDTPGAPLDAAVQGQRLWVVSAAGLYTVRASEAGPVLDPAAQAVAVFGANRAVLGRQRLVVYGEGDVERCQIAWQVPSRGERDVAMDEAHVVVFDGNTMTLLDAQTCAPQAAAPAAAHLLGIDAGRVWAADETRLFSWTLPELRLDLPGVSGQLVAVLAGPKGPGIFTGAAVIDTHSGKSTPVPRNQLLLRGPDRLVGREGADLVVRDGSGAEVARHEAGAIGALTLAVGLDGDVAVTDGFRVLRVGGARQELRFDERIIRLSRGPGATLRVHVKSAAVWEIAPGETAPRRLSGWVDKGLERRGDQRSAVVPIGEIPGRYALIYGGDHLAVWDEDQQGIVGAPLPLLEAGAVSTDGTLAAGLIGRSLLVLETATGAVLRRVPLAGSGADPGPARTAELWFDARQIIVHDRSGWSVIDPESDQALRLHEAEGRKQSFVAEGLGVVDQGIAWPTWDTTPRPHAAPAPVPGAPGLSALQIAWMLTRSQGLRPGEPLCTDTAELDAWLALARSGEAERTRARLLETCRPTPTAPPPEWPALTVSDGVGVAQPGPPLVDVALFGASTRQISVPLLAGRPTLLVRGEDAIQRLLAAPPPEAVDIVVLLTPEVPEATAERLVQLDQPGGRQVVTLRGDETDLAELGLDQAEAVLVGRKGQTLRGDAAAVLEAAAWAGLEAEDIAIPARRARRIWTYRAPERVEGDVSGDQLVLLGQRTLAALSAEGALVWTHALGAHANLVSPQPLLLYEDESTVALSQDDGSAEGRWLGRPSGLEGDWGSLGGAAVLQVSSGAIWVGRVADPNAGTPSGKDLRFMVPGHACFYDLVQDQARTCLANPTVGGRDVALGRLSLREEGHVVTATRADGAVAWTASGWDVRAGSRRRALVRLAGDDGPWATVDSRGRFRERLGLGEPAVLDGEVLLVSGAEVSAWELP